VDIDGILITGPIILWPAQTNILFPRYLQMLFAGSVTVMIYMALIIGVQLRADMAMAFLYMVP